MAMRRHSEDRQSDFWIATAEVARSPGHPFYERMKDGRTPLAHKAEHAVDMATGAVVAVVLHPADQRDTQTLTEACTRTYLSEPRRGRRQWHGKSYEQQAVYANRFGTPRGLSEALSRLIGALLRPVRSLIHLCSPSNVYFAVDHVPAYGMTCPVAA
ncbi:MAG: hypothetical protein GX571_04440 [Lentisphaerae bacterium]|jgi:hypothetical protein|nr:hypothetical protein [Lentisphaerota bacterium]